MHGIGKLVKFASLSHKGLGHSPTKSRLDCRAGYGRLARP
eukprot:SAG11_NODE_13011_length_674_cov_1.057391_1_plen_39_part_10